MSQTMKEIYEEIVDIFVKNRKHFEMTTEEVEELKERDERWRKEYYEDDEEDED